MKALSDRNDPKASEARQRLGSEANSTLRARLRAVTESQRERTCGLTACLAAGPGMLATGRPGMWKTRWTGVATCGHVWTCPVCTMRIRAKRLARVLHALRIAGGRWQMVTLTVRHRNGMPLRALLRGLARAWRRTRQGGVIQRLWTQNVTASVRAFEVTWSRENGWHPHIHVMIRTPEWSDDDRAELLERWQTSVRRELGEGCVPSDERAIDWAEPLELCKGDELSQSDHAKTRYLFKLGLEIAGTSKHAKRKGSTPWELADRAVHGDAEARALWLEYSRATKGRRMIELDDRAARFAKQVLPTVDEDGRFSVYEPIVDAKPIETVVLPVDSLELRALREYERRFDPAILAVISADVASSEKPKAALEAWLGVVFGRLRYTRPNAPQENTPDVARGPPSEGWSVYHFDDNGELLAN